MTKLYGPNYKKFKPETQVDFLETRFKTAFKTNLKTVQPKLNRILNLADGRKAGIDVLDGTQGSATTFAFRIQNPKNFSQVQRIIGDLKRRFDLAEEPTFTALEIAFDLKRRTGTTHDELAEAVAHLYKFASFHPHRENHRIYKRKTADEVPAHMTSLVRHVADGYCIAVGSQRRHTGKHTTGKADPISARYYLKRTDDRHGLDDAMHSARAERTFQDAAMPFRTLAELEQFDFSTLKDLFDFRKLKDELNPLVAAALRDYVLATFDTRTRNRREGGTRENHPATQADSALNELVRRSFRSLSKRWACGNSVKAEEQNHEATEAGTAPADTYSSNNTINTTTQDNNTDDNEATIEELLNYPGTEEDERIANLFEELMACESSAKSGTVNHEATAVRGPSVDTYYSTFFNHYSIHSFKNETPLDFIVVLAPVKLHGWKLFEIFAAQAP